jgi:diguanylate cyclase (GGDEF)-like protein
MPKMNGLELCRAIRNQPRPHYTYVLIASIFAEKQNILAGFEAGVDDYVSKPIDLDELRVRLISAVRVTGVHRELATKNQQLVELGEHLRAESRRDPLTNVGNRLRFQDDIVRLVDQARRYGHRFCLGMCDIDNFKQYNDTYGHLAGDQVLKSVAQVLATRTRSSDRVYRMGGEEFLVIFSEQEEHGAVLAAERLRREVEALGVRHDRNQPYGQVTLTIGLTPLVAHDLTQVDRDLNQADEYLYRGKLGGRNRVVTAEMVAESSAAQPS